MTLECPGIFLSIKVLEPWCLSIRSPVALLFCINNSFCVYSCTNVQSIDLFYHCYIVLAIRCSTLLSLLNQGHFYFYDNFGKYQPMFIIFSLYHFQRICRTRSNKCDRCTLNLLPCDTWTCALPVVRSWDHFTVHLSLLYLVKHAGGAVVANGGACKANACPQDVWDDASSRRWPRLQQEDHLYQSVPRSPSFPCSGKPSRPGACQGPTTGDWTEPLGVHRTSVCSCGHSWLLRDSYIH